MSNDKPDYYAMAEGISKTIGKVTKPLTDAQFIALAGAVAVYVEKALAHEAEKQAGPVAGWKLVPVEPTVEMGWAYLDAARLHAADGAEDTMRFSWGGYRAMLAAAPPSPLTEQDKDDAGMPCPYCADGHMVERRSMVCGGCKGDLVTKRQAGINIAARAKKEQQ